MFCKQRYGKDAERKAGREPLLPRPGELQNYFLWVYVSIATISNATETISCNSSYVLIGTTSDRLGTGAARPPAHQVSILFCHGTVYGVTKRYLVDSVSFLYLDVTISHIRILNIFFTLYYSENI